MVHSSAAALLGITLVGVVAGNRCFVCVPGTGPWRDDVLNMFPGPPELLLCDHFHPKDKRYERECPPQYPGCLTQTSGAYVLRTCSDLGINDCQKANGVQYCYCSGTDLCNFNISSPGMYPVPQPPIDDEDQDISEGSGAGSFPQTKPNPSPTTPHPPHGTTTRSTSANSSVPVSRTLGLLPALVMLLLVAAQ